jgi:hypothetical protein
MTITSTASLGALTISTYTGFGIGDVEIIDGQQTCTLTAPGRDVTVVTRQCGIGEPDETLHRAASLLTLAALPGVTEDLTVRWER